jgi:uncharacterized protein YutE (UPF0331/DUF86 family)
MTDPQLVAKKLAAIETYVADLRRLANPEKIPDDLREERFVEFTLQLAIQAALDVASHIVSDDHLGEPQTNRELFALLAKGGYVRLEQLSLLSEMAGFRNLLVHGYDQVDPIRVQHILREHLVDLERFVDSVRVRIAEQQGT